MGNTFTIKWDNAQIAFFKCDDYPQRFNVMGCSMPSFAVRSLELKHKYGVWTTILNKSPPISSLFPLLHASDWYLMIWETDPFLRIDVILGANIQRYWLMWVEFEETKSPIMFGRLFTLCFIPCPCSHCPFQASKTIEMIGKPLYSGY